MKIEALANIDGTVISCMGEIDIHWIKSPQAYATWKLFTADNLIASKSKNYFFRQDADTEELLLGRIVQDIENYRIGRKKIFEKVELLS